MWAEGRYFCQRKIISPCRADLKSTWLCLVLSNMRHLNCCRKETKLPCMYIFAIDFLNTRYTAVETRGTVSKKS